MYRYRNITCHRRKRMMKILLDKYLQGKFHIAQVGRSRENTASSAHLSGLVITFACIIILRV